MRVTREKAAENRARIVAVAARLFAEKGFDAVGVDAIMAAAGLTHGGFYGQFASKDDLAAEACSRAVEHSVEKWEKLCRENPDSALPAIADIYLSSAHRDQCGTSCLLSTLAIDVSRRDGPVRGVFTRGLQRLLDILRQAAPGRSADVRRERALAIMASLVGAVVLARAVEDPDLSDEILAATRRAVEGGARD